MKINGFDYEIKAFANLYGANLSGANLDGANLHRANLDGANLRGAEGVELIVARTRILPEGSIIGRETYFVDLQHKLARRVR